jgi:hypothetical protein
MAAIFRIYLGPPLQCLEGTPRPGASRLGTQRSNQLERRIAIVHHPPVAVEITSQGDISEARQSLSP